MWNLSLSKADWQSFPKFANTVEGGRVLRVPYLAHVLSPPPPERQRAREGVLWQSVVSSRLFALIAFARRGWVDEGRGEEERREAEWLSSLLLSSAAILFISP